MHLDRNHQFSSLESLGTRQTFDLFADVLQETYVVKFVRKKLFSCFAAPSLYMYLLTELSILKSNGDDLKIMFREHLLSHFNINCLSEVILLSVIHSYYRHAVMGV